MIWVNTIFIISIIAFTLLYSVQPQKNKFGSLFWLVTGCSIGLIINLLLSEIRNLDIVLRQFTWILGPSLYWFVSQDQEEINDKISLHFSPFVVNLFLSFSIDQPIVQSTFIEFFVLSPFARIAHSVVYVLASAFKAGNQKWKRLPVIFIIILLAVVYIHDFGVIRNITSATLMISTVFLLIIVSIWYVKKYYLKTDGSFIQGMKEAAQEKKLLEEVYAKVLRELKDNQLHLNRNLKLSDLNASIGVTEKLISKAINTHSTENFNAFINRFRVKHATNLIEDKKFSHYTIDAIAEESGFSNKVSFYKAFKKFENISPSEYRENIQNHNKQTT